MPLLRWLGVGPRGCEWRVRAGIFGWLYSVLRSRCDNHRRHEGCRVGTEVDMQRGVAEVGDGNVHRARAARLCMYVEALGRPLARSWRAGRQRACVSTHSREAVPSKKTVKYPSNALHTCCITSWCMEGVWGAGVGSDGMQGAARPKRGCAKQAQGWHGLRTLARRDRALTIPPRISRLIPSRPQVEVADGSPRYASQGARRGSLERRVFCHSQAADAAVKVEILTKVFRENLNRPQLWAGGEGWCSRDGQAGPEKVTVPAQRGAALYIRTNIINRKKICRGLAYTATVLNTLGYQNPGSIRWPRHALTLHGAENAVTRCRGLPRTLRADLQCCPGIGKSSFKS